MTEEELLKFTELDEDFAELLLDFAFELDEDFAELQLDTNCFSELLEDNLSPWRLEELIGSTELLLDFAELLLDSGSLPGMTDEELLDFTELDNFAELLLDPIPPSGVQDDDEGATLAEDFTELLLDTIEDEDLAFLLLDEVTSAGSMTLPRLEDDSTPDSSFGPEEEEESSPQATNIIAAETIATRNFFISPPVIQYN